MSKTIDMDRINEMSKKIEDMFKSSNATIAEVKIVVQDQEDKINLITTEHYLKARGYKCQKQ